MFRNVSSKRIYPLAKLMATFFGVGYFPRIPGTVASLLTLIAGWFIIDNFGKVSFALIILLIFFFGWLSSSYVLKNDKKNSDPGFIVADEVVGQGFILLFIPVEFIIYVVAFLSFRFFDILKPWPIYLLEKKFRNAFGIMIDDLFASLYAVLTIKIIGSIYQ